jgi:acyl transferase domain-containing protein
MLAPTRESHQRRSAFVEAHGTGTAVGDPIEAHALAEALCQNRPAGSPLPNRLNQNQSRSSRDRRRIAGLLKAMLILKHGQIPPSLHFKNPSQHIDFETLKLRVPTEMEPFPDGPGERLAGVNSFGSAAPMRSHPGRAARPSAQ